MRAGPLEERLREEGARLGFARVGVTDARPSDHAAFLRSWVARGLHGEMGYLAREDALTRRADLSRTLEGVRSVVVVADHYPAEDPPGVPDDPSRAVIGRYGRGRDYHHVLKERLERLGAWLEGALGSGAGRGEPAGAGPGDGGGSDGGGAGPERHRVYVDTGPILERELARRAGMGWFGRNTMLIDPERGSYFFLGVLLTTAELRPDPPFDADRCGSCTACLDACPTGALLGRDENGAPVMDARKCISYLTIEHRGAIPEELRPLIENRVFGCDICQEVCPWNERMPARLAEAEAGEAEGGERAAAGISGRARYAARAWPADKDGDPRLPCLDGPDLVEFTKRILDMSGKEYRRVFAESPLARPGRKRMLRNLCVALGNYGATSSEAAERVRPVLERAAEDASKLVREHAEWGWARTRD